MSYGTEFEATETPLPINRRRRNLAMLLSGVLLSTLVGCGTSRTSANSPAGIQNCDTWGTIKYNRDRKGSNTPIKSAANLKQEVGGEVTVLAARVKAKGGKINFDDGAIFPAKDSTGTYSVSATNTSLALTFPQLDFHKKEVVTFNLVDKVAAPVENSVLVCSSENGTVYPNGVVMLLNHVMSRTKGLDVLNQ